MNGQWIAYTALTSVAATLLLASRTIAQVASPDDPYSLVLIHADIDDADKVMAIRDVDKNGWLDDKERAPLAWSNKAVQYDLNRDGKLTHLEIALRFASQRDENDVEQIDRTVVSRAMQKYDKNRNGQIDPDELTSAWPEDPKEIDVNSDNILTIEELTNAFAFRRVVREETGIIGVDQGWAIKIRNRFDRDLDGGLNPDEWTNTPLPGNPESFDMDKDKRLSLLEIATMLAKHRQKLGLTAQDQLEARALILQFDTDFSGVITKEEMIPLIAALGDQIEKVKQFDSDKNDEISLLEIETVLSERRDELGYSDRDAAAAKLMITRHDENRDLRISKHELKDETSSGYLGKNEMPQIDRNTDGYIDQDELAKHLAREKPARK